MQHTFSQSRGFTLVETLVAISVLMLSVVGPMTIASRALQSSLFAKDQITAFYLGQEAIEIIRAVRDDNAFNEGTDWLSGLSECTSGVCGVDVQTWAFHDCTDSEDCRIYYDPDGLTTQRGIYTHVSSGNDLTRFVRTVRVNEITNNQEAEIIVDVSWQTGTLARTVTIQSRIFNQFDNLYGTP